MRLWVELVLACGLVVLLGLLELGFVIDAVGAHPHAGVSRLGQVLGAVICFGLLVLSSRWVIHVEHRMRRRQPIAQAFMSAQVAGTPPTADVAGTPKARSVRHGGRRRHVYGPVGTGVFTALFAAGTIGLLVGAISSYSQGVRSGYVQDHGTRANAIVESVDNTQHCGRGGCYYTAAIQVTLSPPVDGARATVVHYPGYSDLIANEPVTVLVDPQQPGYAEFPGSRFVTSWEWTILLVGAVVVGWLTFLDGRALLRLLAHRRDHLAQTAAPLATAAQ